MAAIPRTACNYRLPIIATPFEISERWSPPRLFDQSGDTRGERGWFDNIYAGRKYIENSQVIRHVRKMLLFMYIRFYSMFITNHACNYFIVENIHYMSLFIYLNQISSNKIRDCLNYVYCLKYIFKLFFKGVFGSWKLLLITIHANPENENTENITQLYQNYHANKYK